MALTMAPLTDCTLASLFFNAIRIALKRMRWFGESSRQTLSCRQSLDWGCLDQTESSAIWSQQLRLQVRHRLRIDLYGLWGRLHRFRRYDFHRHRCLGHWNDLRYDVSSKGSTSPLLMIKILSFSTPVSTASPAWIFLHAVFTMDRHEVFWLNQAEHEFFALADHRVQMYGYCSLYRG